MIKQVEISKFAEKQLQKVPQHLRRRLHEWADDVVRFGLEEVRKIPGYHDEPLKGNRAGQRSIRLNLSYRAIYVVKGSEIQFVSIQEVTNHEY
jgi:proteic killer suppression protein